MAYRVKFSGVEVEMDNLRELGELIEALNNTGAAAGASVSLLQARLRQANPVEVVVFHGEKEVAVLDTLLRSSNGVTPRQMADILGTTPVGVRGFMSKWTRRARSVGRELSDLVERQKTYSRGKLEVTYRLTDEGRKYFAASGGRIEGAY